MISSAIIPQPLARLPWRLIWLVAVICTIGVVTLYSAAGGSMSPWAMKQGITILAFFGLAVAISYVPENFIKQMTFPGYIAILVLLIVVEMVGFVGKGAQRWVDLGFIRLQPSEFMKPAIALVLARFYDLLPAGDVRRWRGLWPAAALVLVPVVLILVQPDLGTSVMVLLGGVTVMFIAGLPMWYFVSAAAAAAVAGPILFAFMHDYQRKRVFIFLDPESDPLGAGYHISQSKIAIGSGGIGTGRRRSADLCLLHGHPLGNEGQPEGKDPLWPARRRRADRDHLLLCIDQPDDGNGPRSGGWHPLATRQFRRIGGDDGDDLPRNLDVVRAPVEDPFEPLLIFR